MGRRAGEEDMVGDEYIWWKKERKSFYTHWWVDAFDALSAIGSLSML